jgi:hypothetical protein
MNWNREKLYSEICPLPSEGGKGLQSEYGNV